MQGWDWGSSRCGDSRPVIKENNVAQYVFTTSGHQIDLDLHVPQAIAGAMNHARNVCRREKIKAVDRIERAGIFVTELRRQLGSVPIETKRQHMLIDGMCNRTQWVDVGQFDANSYSYHQNELVTKDRISKWVQLAHSSIPTDVEGDTKALFEQLTGDLRSLDMLVSQAQEINFQADAVVGGLASLAERNA